MSTLNLTELRASSRRKISLSLTSTDYPDVDLDANLNEWYSTILGWIVKATGIWEFNGQMDTTDLVQNQVEYVLPSDLVVLSRVEIKYPESNEYVKATRVDDLETTNAFQNGTYPGASTGAPIYRLLDNSLFIYPKPSAAVVDGLAIELIEDIIDLSVGADVPNLNPLVQKTLSVAAAYEYANANEQWKKAQSLLNAIYGRPGGREEESLKYQIEQLAAQRDRSVRHSVRQRAQSYR